MITITSTDAPEQSSPPPPFSTLSSGDEEEKEVDAAVSVPEIVRTPIPDSDRSPGPVGEDADVQYSSVKTAAATGGGSRPNAGHVSSRPRADGKRWVWSTGRSPFLFPSTTLVLPKLRLPGARLLCAPCTASTVPATIA